MKTVLLTGASGFIGRHAIAPLLARGYEVHAVSLHPQPHDFHTHERPDDLVIWHQANLLDDAQTTQLVKLIRPTHLLHFAWVVEPGKFWTSLDNLRWVQASLTLLRTFAEQGGQRIVVSGTCAEYDWSVAGERLNERNSPLIPETLYGACKRAVSIVTDAFARQHGLSAAWGRIFFLYGPHEPPQKLVASVIRSLLRGQPALCSHGQQVRDFLHVQDVAGAFVSLLDSEVRGPVNIASGQPVALRDVITTIGDLLGRPDLLRFGAIPSQAGEPTQLVADVDRLRFEVGWEPGIRLESGLAGTIEWWRSNETHN